VSSHDAAAPQRSDRDICQCRTTPRVTPADERTFTLASSSERLPSEHIRPPQAAMRRISAASSGLLLIVLCVGSISTRFERGSHDDHRLGSVPRRGGCHSSRRRDICWLHVRLGGCDGLSLTRRRCSGPPPRAGFLQCEVRFRRTNRIHLLSSCQARELDRAVRDEGRCVRGRCVA
jgi:hypothetical protein